MPTTASCFPPQHHVFPWMPQLLHNSSPQKNLKGSAAQEGQRQVQSWKEGGRAGMRRKSSSSRLPSRRHAWEPGEGRAGGPVGARRQGEGGARRHVALDCRHDQGGGSSGHHPKWAESLGWSALPLTYRLTHYSRSCPPGKPCRPGSGLPRPVPAGHSMRWANRPPVLLQTWQPLCNSFGMQLSAKQQW